MGCWENGEFGLAFCCYDTHNAMIRFLYCILAMAIVELQHLSRKLLEIDLTGSTLLSIETP